MMVATASLAFTFTMFAIARGFQFAYERDVEARYWKALRYSCLKGGGVL